MYPEQAPQPQPDYSFITNAGSPKKGLSNLDPKKRIIFVAVLFGAILVLMLLFFSFIRSGNSGGKDQIIDLVAYQTEMVRIADLGSKDATGQARAFAQTGALTFQSDAQQVKAIADKQGVKVSEKELVRYKSSETDAKLEEAKKTNQYNQVFEEVFETQLATYSKKLRAAYDSQKSASSRTTLSRLNQGALLLQFSYTPPTTPSE